MYELYPAKRPYVINASNAYRILAEIKVYLRMLQAANSGLLDDIRDFTRSFGPPHDTFDVDEYIDRISDAAAMNKTRAQILAEERYGVALPPRAVADYVERVWGWATAISEFAVGTGRGDGILGVSSSECDDAGVPKPYHGLEHYLYRTGGSVYSWGQRFTSVQDASRGGAGGVLWRVCYLLSFNVA